MANRMKAGVAIAMCLAFLGANAAVGAPVSAVRVAQEPIVIDTPGDVAAKYSYNYNYTIQTTGDPRRPCSGQDGNAVWKRVNPKLARLFPVPGMPNNIRAGQTVALAGNNKIYVEQVGSRHFQFKALPGHVMGSGNHLKFTFSADGKTLNTNAWGNGGDKNKLLAYVKTIVPKGLWSQFGGNLRQELCPMLGPRMMEGNIS
ncbi:hypothetical protein [Glutamicibacter sp. X7]